MVLSNSISSGWTPLEKNSIKTFDYGGRIFKSQKSSYSKPRRPTVNQGQVISWGSPNFKKISWGFKELEVFFSNRLICGHPGKYQMTKKLIRTRGVMVKAMDCGIVVREFVLQSRYYIHFRANTFGKGMNHLILPAMG